VNALPANILSIDLETACARGCTEACDCALIPHHAKITRIAAWSPGLASECFTSAADFREWLLRKGPYEPLFVGQNFSFDLRMLEAHGCPMPLEQWVFDTQIAAAISLTKVPAEYLATYAEQRESRNKAIGKKRRGHRAGSQYSLKVMAPYFLGVEPFWEDPNNHDSADYALKDAEYTYRLAEFFSARLEDEGLTEFFQTKSMRWARQLVQMSIDGINIDLDGLRVAQTESARLEGEYKAKLDEMWAPAYQAYAVKLQAEVHDKYAAMAGRALDKAKTGAAMQKVDARYRKLEEAALAKLDTAVNIASPDQLAWVMRDYHGLDIRDWEGDDSTAKAVLQGLAAQGREDIKVLLDWRREYKRTSAFYPTYFELQRDGKLHTSFNPTGARTGRISSSKPNLQQCPPHVRKLFVAPEGYELCVYDEAAIEPRMITYYTEDRTLFDLLASGASFHGFNVAVFFGLNVAPNDAKELYPLEYKVAKEGGLSILYGAGARRIQLIGTKYGFTWTLDECKRMVSRIRDAYREVWAFKKQLDEMATAGEPISGFFGQKYVYAPDEVYMKAFNTLIQGSASQLVVESTCRAADQFRAENIDARPLLVVHDEYVGVQPEGHKRAEQIVIESLTDWDLPTRHGPVKLKVEGKCSKRWEK
jgi:DNA polymerase I-like protein with 3'-5' exonuclease and polymerase domains